MKVQKSESIGELAKALQAFHLACPEIKKTKTVDTGRFSYSYAPLPAILKAIEEPLRTCGLTFMQFPISEEDRFGVCTLVMHPASGEWVEGSFTTPVSNGASCQDIGQMTSYYCRYGLNAALGISAEDDTDGQAERPQRPSARVAPPSRDLTREEEMAGTNKGWAKMKAKIDAHCKGEPSETLRLFEELGTWKDDKGKEHTPRSFDISEKWQRVIIGKLERHVAKCKDPRHFQPPMDEPPPPTDDDIPF